MHVEGFFSHFESDGMADATRLNPLAVYDTASCRVVWNGEEVQPEIGDPLFDEKACPAHRIAGD
ncbi:MAG: hypothetical protein AAFP90_19545 [Planctomycetota bacterium]